MKAMTLTAYGDDATFEAADLPKPIATDGHVVVRIIATSINTVDTMIRSMGADLPLSPALPAVLGMDFAGVIEAVGDGVTAFSVGDEVYGCAGGVTDIQGALAEFIRADARLIAHKPKSISMREAAAMPLVGITAYEGLERAGIAAGQKVLVQGGAGGVGHLAVQLAKHFGAEVYGTGTGDKQIDVIKGYGATPIDFAYAIHTRIGSACVGAKIDGMRVPLWTRVKNGQSIEIITAQGQTPQATWLDIATTGKAKTAIRRSLRELDRARFVSLGRELARSAFEQMNKSATEKVLRTAARNLRLSSAEELLAQLGSAELTGQEVVQAVYPNLRPKPGEHVDRKRAVVGLEAGQSFDRSPCCQALPGERIVGITFRGQGVKIHTIDCERLSHYEDQPERWLDLRWHDGPHPAIYGATLDLTIGNGAGVLGRICTLIGQSSANIADLEFLDRKPDFYRLLIYVELRDIAHLHSLIPMLEAESEVAEISRYRNPDLFKAGTKDA